MILTLLSLMGRLILIMNNWNSSCTLKQLQTKIRIYMQILTLKIALRLPDLKALKLITLLNLLLRSILNGRKRQKFSVTSILQLIVYRRAMNRKLMLISIVLLSQSRKLKLVSLIRMRLAVLTRLRTNLKLISRNVVPMALV